MTSKENGTVRVATLHSMLRSLAVGHQILSEHLTIIRLKTTLLTFSDASVDQSAFPLAFSAEQEHWLNHQPRLAAHAPAVVSLPGVENAIPFDVYVA
jgi:hypothetical protein